MAKKTPLVYTFIVNEVGDLASLQSGQHVEVYGHADFLRGLEAEQVIATQTVVSSL